MRKAISILIPAFALLMVGCATAEKYGVEEEQQDVSPLFTDLPYIPWWANGAE